MTEERYSIIVEYKDPSTKNRTVTANDVKELTEKVTKITSDPKVRAVRVVERKNK